MYIIAFSDNNANAMLLHIVCIIVRNKLKQMNEYYLVPAGPIIYINFTKIRGFRRDKSFGPKGRLQAVEAGSLVKM